MCMLFKGDLPTTSCCNLVHIVRKAWKHRRSSSVRPEIFNLSTGSPKSPNSYVWNSRSSWQSCRFCKCCCSWCSNDWMFVRNWFWLTLLYFDTFLKMQKVAKIERKGGGIWAMPNKKGCFFPKYSLTLLKKPRLVFLGIPKLQLSQLSLLQ